jgi:ribose transport system permease protein
MKAIVGSLVGVLKNRVVGILLMVLVLYGLTLASDPNARTLGNHQNVGQRVALYGVLTLGAGILIIAGGIDLSIGSVFCLAGVSLGLLMNARAENISSVFVIVTVFTASCCIAASAIARLSEDMRALLAVPLGLLLGVFAPAGLALVLVRPIRARGLSPGAALPLAVLAGSAAWLGPWLIAWALQSQPGLLAVATVLLGGGLIGLLHGIVITRLGLQPFIVTLCGLFVWRGMAYWLALPDPLAPLRGLGRAITFGQLFAEGPIQSGSAGTVGIGAAAKNFPELVHLANGYPSLPLLGDVPMRLLLLLLLAGLAGVLMHLSVHGRYLFAVGSNEQAARYAGIPANRYKVLAYILCSMLAALGGMIQLLEIRTVQPSNSGQFYELFAITGAVLGGCSLRGGEGTVIGMLLGTAVLPLLRNLINLSGLTDDLEYLVIGLALMAGTILDELLKRRAAAKGKG